MRGLRWLIRREFWENPAIWLLPSFIGALLFLAALFGDVDLASPTALSTPDQPPLGGALWLFGFGMVIFAVSWLYSSWYLLDSLYGERKDRSVLFWRSLPVSDIETVASKLIIALIVIPVVAFLVADVATFGMALAVTARASGTTLRSLLWKPQYWLELQVLWVYLIATMGVWYLPVAGWLLVVSAWARKSIGLWAVMPILIPFLIERWLLHTHAIGTLIAERFSGFLSVAFHNNADEAFSFAAVTDRTKGIALSDRNVWELINPRGLFTSTATWIGVAVGIVLIAIAIELRHRRVEQ
jgi:ABC-2 type transport system permease protein